MASFKTDQAPAAMGQAFVMGHQHQGGAIQAVPEPVLGGAAMVMFGAVAASGINILASITLDRRALLIIAVSLALGLGVSQVPEFLAHMPAALRNVLESGVATGGICALLLNWFLPETEKKPTL